MRVEFRGEGPRFPDGLAGVPAAFAPIISQFAMEARISDRTAKPRFVIAVSPGSHCPNALPPRSSTGKLAIDFVRVVSNHEAPRRLSGWPTLPSPYLPATHGTHPNREGRVTGK